MGDIEMGAMSQNKEIEGRETKYSARHINSNNSNLKQQISQM
jgi:hypothetical protein